jgi:hypothetical protein
MSMPAFVLLWGRACLQLRGRHALSCQQKIRLPVPSLYLTRWMQACQLIVLMLPLTIVLSQLAVRRCLMLLLLLLLAPALLTPVRDLSFVATPLGKLGSL